MAVTPEDLDLLRNPARIFHALLEAAFVPEDRKAFLRRAQERFEDGTMGIALFSRVLELAHEFGLFLEDMRPCIGEVSALVQPPELERIAKRG